MTPRTKHRVNARLPPEAARKLAYLEVHTQRSPTQVLRESIDRMYEAVRADRGPTGEILARAGFIGCANGPATLSASYKKAYARSLAKKA